MTTENIQTDVMVDALLAGETVLDAETQLDPKRAAGLLVVHALLLRQEAPGDALAMERSLAGALTRIRAEPSRTAGRSVVLRRVMPLAAAILLVASVALWWNISAEHRAVAEVTSTHTKQGPRRYQLVVQRTPAAVPATLTGTYDVNGYGQFVVRLPLPTGDENNRVVYGRGETDWWIITPAGVLERGPANDIILKWVRAVAGDAPLPSIDETLSRLEEDYDVSIEVLPDGGDRYHAVLTAAIPGAATAFELTINRESRRVRSVRWVWDPPVGSIAAVVSVAGNLIERRPFPDGWFEPEAHMSASEDELALPVSPPDSSPALRPASR